MSDDITLSEKVGKLCSLAAAVSTQLTKISIVNKNLSDAYSFLVKEDAVQDIFPLPRSEYRFCIVCNMPRLDPDITGLTCGEVNCLSGLHGIFPRDMDEYEQWREQFAEQEELLREIGEFLGITGTFQINKRGDLEIVPALQDIRDELKSVQEKMEALEKKLESEV